jgi:hypothetical protein
MIFDKELTFIDAGKLEAFTGGVLGDPLDLGADGQFLGRQAYVAVCCGDDTTATGNPEILFSLEFADDASFAGSVKVPLSLPPLGKEDMAKGASVIARLPLYSKRFVRLHMGTDIELACSNITAGITLDPQTNR